MQNYKNTGGLTTFECLMGIADRLIVTHIDILSRCLTLYTGLMKSVFGGGGGGVIWLVISMLDLVTRH